MASALEEISGVGAQRRQALLRHLGGLQEVSRATVDELVRVPGISAQIAKRIYDTFHGDELPEDVVRGKSSEAGLRSGDA
jgi:excinuclease ABC subunit C